MTFIQYVDSIVEKEIENLTARISSADELLVEFNSLITSITSIKKKLEDSKDNPSYDSYLVSYKLIIDSLAELLNLNSQILSKLILFKSYQSQNDKIS